MAQEHHVSESCQRPLLWNWQLPQSYTAQISLVMFKSAKCLYEVESLQVSSGNTSPVVHGPCVKLIPVSLHPVPEIQKGCRVKVDRVSVSLETNQRATIQPQNVWFVTGVLLAGCLIYT